MKLKKTLAVTFTAALALAGGASSAYAADRAVNNENQLLSCLHLPLLGDLLLDNGNTNIDCSENYEEKTDIKKTTKIDRGTKVVVSPEQHQGQGQGQGQKQEGEQAQEQEFEQEFKKNHKDIRKNDHRHDHKMDDKKNDKKDDEKDDERD